ncbi:MAG: hypothetical protein ACJ746_05035 [Bryobacteraceae bacterium]
MFLGTTIAVSSSRAEILLRDHRDGKITLEEFKFRVKDLDIDELRHLSALIVAGVPR